MVDEDFEAGVVWFDELMDDEIELRLRGGTLLNF
jgi:hypothetical protein